MGPDRRIKRIAIVGGGTAGWFAASILARMLRGTCAIHLIESPDIPTIGVGEATVPGILDLLYKFLKIDQNDFMERTQATIKLAIRFKDWSSIGHAFWHPFGDFGAPIDRLPFYHFWHKAKTLGLEVDVAHFNLEIAMAEANKFIYPGNSLGVAPLRYALHFDAGLVARYLRAYSEALGVQRMERSVVGASQLDDGSIDEVIFADGGRLKADLYIDCSGFRGLLIEQTLKTGYLDWTPLLPCNRAVATQVPNQIPRPPYVMATARSAGWQWRIPLQHRVGTGYVYSSDHLSDEDALKDLLAVPGNEPLVEPRFIRYTTGRRNLFWNKNCIALGLASGFIEPLESTSIHLMYSGVYNLLDHFPDATLDPVNIADYNAQMIEEYERIRDFIILHYCTTKRTDSPMWLHCQQMPLPDSLSERIELYKRTGRIFQKKHELFVEPSWFFVMEGMGLRPRDYNPLVEATDFEQVKRIMSGLRQKIASDVAAAPTHDSFFPDAPEGAITRGTGWKLAGSRTTA